jgi:acetyl-CoA carboxylase carboxyltransferase component
MDSTAFDLTSPVAATVVSSPLAAGSLVRADSVVVVLESMKIEQPVRAPRDARIVRLLVGEGETVAAGDVLAVLEAADIGGDEAAVAAAEADRDGASEAPGGEQQQLAELEERKALLDDAARPDQVAKRRALGRRTARENIADLCDPDSLEEIGGLAVAAQRARKDLDELRQRTPADGVIVGTARVNGNLVGDQRSRCAVMSYDYMVLAGTQGFRGHHKTDRFFEIVRELELPVVLFAEGGGGRPGDTDFPVVSGNTVRTFAYFAQLSGLVPTVGVVSGRCFAGNAALLGCCDVIIATPDANIGMAGPALIEGGGLGVFSPEDIGPIDVQVANGVVDIVVADDADAVRLSKQYLSYFQGPVADWESPDQTELRSVVPENRKHGYDMRTVIDGLADVGSVLELRPDSSPGMITSLVRIEGRPFGVVANNPTHLGGAIDAEAADSASRMMSLCDAHDLPVLFLCDTPGFMVGPEAEKMAQVRRFGRQLNVAASLTVPFFTVITRKGYGLGALAMAGGSFYSPLFTVAWPTGEIGGMGIEGAVTLGSRRQLEAIDDPEERQQTFDALVEEAYRRSKALNAAEIFELDDVIDPAATRARLVNVLGSVPEPVARRGKKRPVVDAW